MERSILLEFVPLQHWCRPVCIGHHAIVLLTVCRMAQCYNLEYRLGHHGHDTVSRPLLTLGADPG